jgi:hypothetical protein
MSQAFSYEEHDGVLAGPERAPRNSARHLGAGSIHDDATAQKLGFRGGTVAGSLHMEQFPPLLVETFGERWLRTGGLSLYFKYATTDGEPVRAFVRRSHAKADADDKVDVWMDDAQGNRICDGTASVGAADTDSTVRQRIAAMPAPQDIRILANVTPGDVGGPVPTRLTQEALDRRLEVITEPLPAYSDATAYGHTIATPALQVQVLRPAESLVLPRNSDFGVGLFGAIELQLLDGPVFVEYDYEASARVLAVGETPKTEYLYYEAILHDPDKGVDVLSMIMMLRFMKASSKLWQ